MWASRYPAIAAAASITAAIVVASEARSSGSYSSHHFVRPMAVSRRLAPHGPVPQSRAAALSPGAADFDARPIRRVLSVRGGGLFGFGSKSEDDEKKITDAADDDDANAEDFASELYELTDPPAPTGKNQSEAQGETESEDGDDSTDEGSDTATATPATEATAKKATSRTVEMKASSRHIFGSHGPLLSLESLLPILKSERSQFVAMSSMMFLFIYVFTTVRDTKDTLIVSHCGAESIPFLKLYGVMPCAVLFIVVYSKLSNTLGRDALFYVTLVPFFFFYGLFAYVLYPNRDAIHFLPQGGNEAVTPGVFSLIRYWSYSLYFIVSELWASAGVPLLFWQVS